LHIVIINQALFNLSIPLLRIKQKEVDIQDLCGLFRIHWRVGQKTLIDNIYTRIDQVFLIWAVIIAGIFLTAQFSPISWQFQAVLWSILTVVGTIAMICLTHFWVLVEQLRWVVLLWTVLMLIGLGITNIGIFCSIPVILVNLCPLWLGLSALGYVAMGWGMYSRTFILMGLFHLLGIMILPYFLGWQFLTTGLIMASSLILLSELQWDMRPPIESKVLTSEEVQFNRKQNQLRQSQI
jgi:hypothetical protein